MMQLSAFITFLINRGCECKPKEGGNLTGSCIIVTRKVPNSNISRRAYLEIYPNGMVSRTTIKTVCYLLLLDSPI